MGSQQEQHGAEPFAGGYSNRQRVVEGGLLLVSLVTWAYSLVRLGRTAPAGSWWYLGALGFVTGVLVADLLSGLVHWGCDTWGSIDTPFLGRTVIRTFREHHLDQKAITRHDFIETNGSTAVVGALPMLWGLCAPVGRSSFWWFFAASCVAATLFITITSQIHKWAHQERPSPVIRALQRARLLLTAEHHAGHHTAPYVRNYCITTGWLNRPLEVIQFFPLLERVLERITGTPPRYDPAAEALARREGVAPEGFFAGEVERSVEEHDAAGPTGSPAIVAE